MDSLNENEDGAEALVNSLLEGQVTALLIQNIERLDESVKEEADGVYNSLGKIYLYILRAFLLQNFVSMRAIYVLMKRFLSI